MLQHNNAPALQMADAGVPVRAAALTTVGLGAIAWVVVVQQTTDVDMTHATGLGPFPSFISWWMWMMAAMMLPGAAPAAFRHAKASRSVPATLFFVVSYLVIWTAAGGALYALYPLYLPHASFAAGAVATAAGIYELTPLKRHFRRRCGESVRSGLQFGLYCLGSSVGLMLLLVALGLMSATWMLVIAVIMVGQKLLPAKPAIDVPVGLAVLGLGILFVVAPSLIGGLTSSV